MKLLLQAVRHHAGFTKTRSDLTNFTSCLHCFSVISGCKWFHKWEHFYDVANFELSGDLSFFEGSQLVFHLYLEGTNQVVHILLDIQNCRLLQVTFKSLMLFLWDAQRSLFLAVRNLLRLQGCLIVVPLCSTFCKLLHVLEVEWRICLILLMALASWTFHMNKVVIQNHFIESVLIDLCVMHLKINTIQTN